MKLRSGPFGLGPRARLLAAALAAMLLMASAGPAATQQRSQTSRALDDTLVVEAVAPDTVGVAPMVFPGTLAALMGAAGGAFLGYQIDARVFQGDGAAGALAGWFFGPVLTTPSAVHSADGRRGDLAKVRTAAALVAAAGLGATLVVRPLPVHVILVAPVAHVVTAIATEHRTAP